MAGLGVREGIDPFMTLAFVSLPTYKVMYKYLWPDRYTAAGNPGCFFFIKERQNGTWNEKVGGNLYGSGENISPEGK